MDDKYIWLEDLESAEAMAWVDHANSFAEIYFENNKFFLNDKQDYESVLLAEDQLPKIQMHDGWIYETHQNRYQKQGLFRRLQLTGFVAGSANWHALLDLDELSKIENVNWVLNRVQFLKNSSKVLLGLSDGGSDAVTWKEFDLKTKSFQVSQPFFLPASKSSLKWYDHNTLIVLDALSDDSRTTCGYARHVRIWKRGQNFSESKIIFSCAKENISVQVTFDSESLNLVLSDVVTFTTTKVYQVKNLEEIIPIQIPVEFDTLIYFQSHYFVENKVPWKIDSISIPAGSLISWPADETKLSKENMIIIFSPDQNQFLSDVFCTKNNLHLITLKNIQTVIHSFEFKDGHFSKMDMDLPVSGIINYGAADNSDDIVFWHQCDFLIEKQYVYTEPLKPKKVVKKTAAYFDHPSFETHQLWTVSPDGTKIPYFIIHRKNLIRDGNNAVWMNGYGGFEVSETPHYLGTIGKVWLEKNGVYVVANIRGGGEFGPAWHQSAILQNKQNSYDDFICVAEDLIKRKITSPKKLGIEGGSNGGLLVGAVSMQRPDLFGAVVCHVPLLDMLRYHKLHAGASWMAEFGNPDIPEQRSYIEKYSPYQNVKPGIKYPEFFFYTSTKDDRVHPGHARKMAAKLMELNQSVIFYEKQDGGHSRSADLLESAALYAKFSSFFKKTLKLEN